MDDTCAVCAETLEWAAYGRCGHREVCSTCITRLRFICDDHRCCICKSESNIVFVTRALGDYTRMIKDFSVFPVDPSEGQLGPYWYHEGTQAFFDDFHHYKVIAAMCRLSCIVCEKKDDQGSESSKRRDKFRNIGQLKSHLFHHHKLFMCTLCLEGRKVFICEQKLYTRSQLNRHIKTGDSKVDGNDSERGGFMGHPMCEFCQTPYYGESELYAHMSTEHYTCHICQRQHPGRYDYYGNYDDLEIHFRQEHFLCEDEACLAKKFVAFATESEMKRHNAMEHRGHMSRSKRNAALQIPISFRYRGIREQGQSRGEHGSHASYFDDQLDLGIQASLEAANSNEHRVISSSVHADSGRREASEIDSVLGSLESLPRVPSQLSSGYSRAAQNSRNVLLDQSFFPPLPVAATSIRQNHRNNSEGLGQNTMAIELRQWKNVTVRDTSRARSAVSRQPTVIIGGSSQLRPMSDSIHPLSSGSARSATKPATGDGLVPSNSSSSRQIRSTNTDGVSASSASSATGTISSLKGAHSASTPNLMNSDSVGPAISDFPPISSTNNNKLAVNTPSPDIEDVRAANKSLVERIRADLEFDEDKFAAFKLITSEYRKDLMDAWEYLAYVYQFGLPHLVPELARLCPDAQKQKELSEAYDSSQLKHEKSSKKGKEKCDEDNGISSKYRALADCVVRNMRELHLNSKPSEEVEILSKDDEHCSAKGKSKVPVDDNGGDLNSGLHQPPGGLRIQNHTQPAADTPKASPGTKGGGNKPRKKTSKFYRVRLGNTSSESDLDYTNSDPHPGPGPDREVFPVQGAWRNGGGQRLVANWLLPGWSAEQQDFA